MKLPVHLDGQTIRDAEGRVIISALNPCNMAERRQIVEALNATAKAKDEKPKCRYRNEEILKERSVGGHMLLLSRYTDTEQDDHEFYGIALDCVIVNSGTLTEMEAKFRQWARSRSLKNFIGGRSHGKSANGEVSRHASSQDAKIPSVAGETAKPEEIPGETPRRNRQSRPASSLPPALPPTAAADGVDCVMANPPQNWGRFAATYRDTPKREEEAQ